MFACSFVSSALAMYSSELRPKLRTQIYYYCLLQKLFRSGNAGHWKLIINHTSIIIINVLLVLTKILEIEVFNITSPRYNKQIFPVPWHFVESRFQCMRLCTEAWVCSDLVPLAPPPLPSAHVTCTTIHHHCHSLFANAYIYI